MRVVSTVILAMVLASPALMSAEASQDESAAHEAAVQESGHGGDPGELNLGSLLASREFQGTLVNFIVLVGLLVWVIRKKGNPALAARRAEVEKELEEARRLRAEAERRHLGTASRLQKLDHEMVQIRGEMIKAGEAERDRIVAQAEEKAARIRKDTSFLIEQQMKQLRKELLHEAANAAVVAAEELLRERTTDADHDQLAQAYLKRLDEVFEERQS